MHTPRQIYLEFDAVDPERIACRFGTPAFVLSRTALRKRLSGFAEAMRTAWPHASLFYSMKANPNPWVLREALSEGWGLDACSGGDLWLAERAGADSGFVSFTGVGASKHELAHACEVAGIVNICTPAQVEHVEALTARVGIRLAVAPSRTGIAYATNKFGLTAPETAEAGEALGARGIELRGLHCHVGSALTDEEDLADILSRSLLDAVDLLSNRARSRLEYVNVGGGVGVFYDDQAGGMDPVRLSRLVDELMATLSERVGHRLELHAEPGEWVVGPPGALLTRVTNVFARGGTRVAVVDASLNQYMGTSFYRPDNTLSVVAGTQRAASPHDVFGATNAPGDVFCRARTLPQLEEGDLVVLHCAGAYGYARGGRFNEHPQAPEVWVDGARCAVARTREPLTVLDQFVPESLEWTDA